MRTNNISTVNTGGQPCRGKIAHWFFSVGVALALILGSAGHVFAAPEPSENVNVLISFNESTDSIPPTTIIKIDGVKGNLGWYRSDVTVELTAEDNTGGSGVALTRYSMDGGETWQDYLEPFTIDHEGVGAIMAQSQDNAGNLEQLPVSTKFEMDKTGPLSSISSDLSTINQARGKQTMVDIIITSSAIDKLSGLDSFKISVKDEYGLVQPVVQPLVTSKIKIDASCEGRDHDGRNYTFTLTTTDFAGNTSTAETIVTVLHDRGKG